MLPGFVTAAEVLLFRQKDPKPVTPHPATVDGTDAGDGRQANSLRSDKARWLIRASDPGAAQQASNIGKRRGDRDLRDSIWGSPISRLCFVLGVKSVVI